MSANDKQISGSHYKLNSIQPWDYVAANNLGYFEGSAIKYITRWRNKGGIADLQKAIHFLEKLIELESPSTNPVATLTSDPVKERSARYLERSDYVNQKSHPSGYPNGSKLDWVSLNEALRQFHNATDE